MTVLRRALVYFAIAFGAGFVLGTIRVLVLVPRFGERAAELAEAPVMLAVIFLAARFVVRRFPSPDRLAHLRSGGVALGLMLAIEFTVVLSLRGLSLAEYFSSRDPIAGAVYAASLAVFALMPWWVAGRSQAANAG